jgi:hypothetical protein
VNLSSEGDCGRMNISTRDVVGTFSRGLEVRENNRSSHKSVSRLENRKEYLEGFSEENQ